MKDWLEGQLAAGFPALAGTTVSGTVAVNQELLNELLTTWLANPAQNASGAAPAVDMSRLTPLIKSARIRAEPGTVLIDFHIAI
jgi:hypothetical protein